MRPSLFRTWPGMRAVVVVLVLGCGLTGCSNGSERASDPASASSASSASSAASGSASTTPSPRASTSNGPSGSGSATKAPSRGADPVVKTYRRVLRNGRTPVSSVSAAPTTFDGTVRYGDGLRLAVTGVRQGAVTATGPGEFPGEPTTRVDLRMTNGGRTAVPLDAVVVTAIYGPARRRARPVYDDTAQDFSGKVAPGRSATAVYAFSIPRKDLGQVTMIVDFDGRHAVATFRGDPRAAKG